MTTTHRARKTTARVRPAERAIVAVVCVCGVAAVAWLGSIVYTIASWMS